MNTTFIPFKTLSISKERALKWCIAITISVMVIELVMGYISNSLMLFSDGLHMLSHAASLAITLGAIHISKQRGNDKVELWAAIVNGIGLLVFTSYILVEAWNRFQSPEFLLVESTLVVAVLGLLVNLLTAFILGLSGVEDLNTRSAYLHMLADTLSSIAIIAGVIVIYYTDWYWIDAVLSALVAIVVGKWAVALLSQSFRALIA